MIYLGLWLLVLGVSAAQAASITQQTEGWCSPAVGQTGGNVTIICQGVDPKALQRLNELLDKKDLELQAKIRDANEWARKYDEVTRSLAEEAKYSELARQAEALLKEGKLEEAGALLDRLIESREERLAAHYFNRAQVFALQFQSLKALSHYEQAYRYRPTNRQYAHNYAVALHKQRRYTEAEPLYQGTLKALRALVDTDGATHLYELARVLRNLALLYHDARNTQRINEAEAAYQEALGIYQQLASVDATAYMLDSVATLNGLANLYRDTRRFNKAIDVYQEALGICRQQAKVKPSVYLPEAAATLHNWGVLYQDTQNFSGAETTYREALRIYRDLAETNSAAYLPEVASTLTNLAVIYASTQRPNEAEDAFQEVLRIRQQLANANPAAHRPELATALRNLARFYFETYHFKKAENINQEALRIYRDLAEANPTIYWPDLATTLNDLAILAHKQDDMRPAQEWIEEALIINRDLWRNDPAAHGNRFARSLELKVLLLKQVGADQATICGLLQEANRVAGSDSLMQWAQEQMETSCGKRKQ